MTFGSVRRILFAIVMLRSEKSDDLNANRVTIRSIRAAYAG